MPTLLARINQQPNKTRQPCENKPRRPTQPGENIGNEQHGANQQFARIFKLLIMWWTT